jgi:hypothetical protein
MSKGKRRSAQHLINERGEQLFKSCLPPHWVLHDYRPDYGIDFSLETFAAVEPIIKGPDVYETLGEHLFIQLKTVEVTDAPPLLVYGRPNVEKTQEQLNREDPIGQLDTIRFSLEIEELVSVERMGVGVPVMLVIASLSDNCCYFVCLNDYIDKILIPRFDNYAKGKSRTIHVPLLNKVDNTAGATTAFRWYAKRAKLYAAFQRFGYQAAELKNVPEGEGFYSLAQHFAQRVLAYDFWHDTDNWKILGEYGDAVRNFVLTGRSGLSIRDPATEQRLAEDGELREWLRRIDVLRLWDLLALLSRNYEDVCREWYLPTGLGYMSTYSGRPHSGTRAQNIGVISGPGEASK